MSTTRRKKRAVIRSLNNPDQITEAFKIANRKRDLNLKLQFAIKQRKIRVAAQICISILYFSIVVLAIYA
jgi:hypothetical protein